MLRLSCRRDTAGTASKKSQDTSPCILFDSPILVRPPIGWPPIELPAAAAAAAAGQPAVGHYAVDLISPPGIFYRWSNCETTFLVPSCHTLLVRSIPGREISCPAEQRIMSSGGMLVFFAPLQELVRSLKDGVGQLQ